MRDFAGDSQRLRKIVGAQERNVDAVLGQDLFDLVERLLRLDVEHDQRIVVRRLAKLADVSSPVMGGPHEGVETAHASGGELRGGDGA